MVLTGVPRAIVPRRRAHRRARLLLAGVAAGPLLALLALVASLGRSATPAQAVPAAADERAFAQIAAEDVLAGRPTDLPYATGLDPYLGRDVGGAPPTPIAYRSLQWRSSVTGQVAGERYEVDDFLVATDDSLWQLSIQVLDTASGPVVGADPGLAPDPTAPSSDAAPLSYGALDGVHSADLGPGAQRQIQAWAEAYVNGDAATLYRLTGDTHGDVFATLTGWQLDQAQVTGAAIKGASALAQVSVTMHLRQDPEDRCTASYDVLLGSLGQALPWVQAWGPPGSGPNLVPLADALAPAPPAEP